MVDKTKLIQAAKELKRRKKLEYYRNNFEAFATEQVKILPKDSSQGFIKFEFNDAQRIINQKIEEQLRTTGKVRAIILKARQMGISTFTCARVFWKAYLYEYQKNVVMAHDAATSDSLFNMSRNLIGYMDQEFVPELETSNAKEIKFKHNHSGYRLYTAGSPEAGRGTTPTVCHLSEVAFWTHDEKILAGLFQGISQADGTEVILESTANGIGNAFHRIWSGAVRGENEYIPIFVPWFLMTEYRREPYEGFELTPDEKEYKEKYNLDDSQMYWRRLKIAESGELKFRQEYPATPEEAFIVSGNNVFDLEKLNSYIPQKALGQKEFNYMSCLFEDKPRGPLEIYQFPKHNEPFIIGADVALGVGQDYSCAVVLDKERRVCAVFRDNRIDPSQFGDLLFYLGRYYNNALLAVESNSMGIATLNRLKQMKYVNLYHQTKVANVSDEEGQRLGWRTTIATKSVIVGHLKNAIENHDVAIPSAYMIHELMMFVSDDNGKVGAVRGEHDDTVIALAIALEVLRTHGDRLDTQRVPWTQRVDQIKEPTYNWL